MTKKVPKLRASVAASATASWANRYSTRTAKFGKRFAFPTLRGTSISQRQASLSPRERVTKTPFLGECRGVGIYLLYNGILGDKSASGGNVLTRAVLAQLPPYDGQKVIYCAGCLLGRDRLQAERIIIRQIPYEIKIA